MVEYLDIPSPQISIKSKDIPTRGVEHQRGITPTPRTSPVSGQAPLTTENAAKRLPTVALQAITATSSSPFDLQLA